MPDSMELGFIINLEDPAEAAEILAFAARKARPGGGTVAFMLGGGRGSLTESPEVLPAVESFVNAGGRLLDCHPCLALSQKRGSGACDVQSICELPEAVRECSHEFRF